MNSYISKSLSLKNKNTKYTKTNKPKVAKKYGSKYAINNEKLKTET